MASTMAILSTQAFATTTQTTRVIPTEDVSSQAVAYELALDKLQTLKADSAIELNNDLGHISLDYPRSLSLNDGSYVTVAEKMNANGEISYTGLVNVSVTFEMAD
ncbi:DUF3316 domain-containing protein [Psychromonas sp. KJ10-10]|uniref:DUF3316 domain-containing protein n=1 Tax=Psychromonas sp. KJ10-10 TaxID=3391823 RepID=UPI0039B4505A